MRLVLIVRIVPVSTLYFFSRTGSPSELRTVLPFESFFLTQFLRSSPIPPVTSTVVKNIGEIPFVPATSVVANVTTILAGLGSQGLIGLVAIWVLYEIWSKR